MTTPSSPHHSASPARSEPRRFEIFVSEGFNPLELSCVTQVLTLANDILQDDRFDWRYVSDTAGLVTGTGGMILRAEPAIANHGFSDVMVVLGGADVAGGTWKTRARQMQAKGHIVALLSDAATAYIRHLSGPTGAVTTHWRDADILREAGYYPDLSDRLSEKANGIITAAGQVATSELVISLIAPQLGPDEVAELGHRLLLPAVRKPDAEQPRNISDNQSLFDDKIQKIIALMEQTLTEPLSMQEICDQAGLSTRQVERLFRATLNESPGRFYKRLRAKKAWQMVEETTLPLMDIAVATGFNSPTTMSGAVRRFYGATPAHLRNRRHNRSLHFSRR